MKIQWKFGELFYSILELTVELNQLKKKTLEICHTCLVSMKKC